ncbi:hypothetical protein V5F40_22715 [Xanthobacter sp. DSM 14520]|uniref:hypothetical protein n=1 Tax=Xanthobacter autotrophicus (strain ATCC BAA-1158 / Py2) TaxID=78245 RepID=UPI00372787DF
MLTSKDAYTGMEVANTVRGVDIATGQQRHVTLMNALRAAEILPGPPTSNESFDDRKVRFHNSFNNRPTMDRYKLGTVVGFESVYEIEGKRTQFAKWPSPIAGPVAYQEARAGIIQIANLAESGLFRTSIIQPSKAVALNPDFGAEIEQMFNPLDVENTLAARKIMIATEDNSGQQTLYALPHLVFRGDGQLVDPVGAAARELFTLNEDGRADLSGVDVAMVARRMMQSFVYGQLHTRESGMAAGLLVGALSGRSVEDAVGRLQFRDGVQQADRDQAAALAQSMRNGELRAVIMPGSTYGVFPSVKLRLQDAKADRGMLADQAWFHGVVGLATAFNSAKHGFTTRPEPQVTTILPEDPRIRHFNPYGKPLGLTNEAVAAIAIAGVAERDPQFAAERRQAPASPSSSLGA